MRKGSFAGSPRGVLFQLCLIGLLAGCGGESAFLSPQVANQRAAPVPPPSNPPPNLPSNPSNPPPVTPATPVSLSAIEVTPSAQSLVKGLSIQFTATGSFSDNSTQDLTSLVAWTTADSAVATIDNAAGHRGVATGASIGTTQVIASYGGLTATTPLQVTAATLVSLAVTPDVASITNGLAKQFNVIGTYTDNSTQNLTSTAIWSSSSFSVATIGNSAGSVGLATSVDVGSTIHQRNRRERDFAERDADRALRLHVRSESG